MIEDVCAGLVGVLEVLTVERGKELTRRFPRRGELTIEHFGFQDGPTGGVGLLFMYFVKLLGGEYFFAPSMAGLTAGMPL